MRKKEKKIKTWKIEGNIIREGRGKKWNEMGRKDGENEEKGGKGINRAEGIVNRKPHMPLPGVSLKGFPCHRLPTALL